MTSEEAKAVQEVAKFGQKGVDAARDAGGFLAKTFGKAIEHVAGAMEDKAAAYRVRNRAKVIEKTRRYLKQLRINETNSIDYRNGIPLLEGIAEEPDESLQDVWAAYLANALNPSNHAVTANRQLIDIIRKLEPEDLPLLSQFSLKDLEERREKSLIKKQHTFHIGSVPFERSIARLTALGLFVYNNGPDVITYSGKPEARPCRIVVETSLGEFAVTPLLMYLKAAIEPPPS